MSDTGVGKRRIHTEADVTLTSLALLGANNRIASSYLFDASAQTVTILDSDFNTPLMVVNVTDGKVIYNPSVAGQTGSMFSNILTLVYDTTDMSDTDELLIFYESTSPLEVELPVGQQTTTEDTLARILTELKILNLYMHQLPLYLNEGIGFGPSDESGELRKRLTKGET